MSPQNAKFISVTQEDIQFLACGHNKAVDIVSFQPVTGVTACLFLCFLFNSVCQINQEYPPVSVRLQFQHSQTWIMQEVSETHSGLYQDLICLPATTSGAKEYAKTCFSPYPPQFGQCVTWASGWVLALTQNPPDKEKSSGFSSLTDESTQKGKPAVAQAALGLHVLSVWAFESLSIIQDVKADWRELCCLMGWPSLLGQTSSLKHAALRTLMCSNSSLFSLAIRPHVTQDLRHMCLLSPFQLSC